MDQDKKEIIRFKAHSTKYIQCKKEGRKTQNYSFLEPSAQASI